MNESQSLLFERLLSKLSKPVTGECLLRTRGKCERDERVWRRRRLSAAHGRLGSCRFNVGQICLQVLKTWILVRFVCNPFYYPAANRSGQRDNPGIEIHEGPRFDEIYLRVSCAQDKNLLWILQYYKYSHGLTMFCRLLVSNLE